MKERKPPLRMCVGCRQMKPKRELLRLVRTPEGQVLADPTGKKNGRGAYVCISAECLKKAVKQRQLERALEIKIGDDVLQQLQQAVAQAGEASE